MANAPHSQVTFTIRELKYGGYEVLAESDANIPRRHVCDFRSEFEAKTWISENGPTSSGDE